MHLQIGLDADAQTLALFRPPRRPRDPAAYTSRIPLIRLLAYPLLSPALALTTLGLLHFGIEAIFPLATFAWVTTLLSRPGTYGNVTMRRTVLYIVGLSVSYVRRARLSKTVLNLQVVSPAVIFALIKSPSPFSTQTTSPAEPSPLKKLVPKESAPLSQWQAEFYSLSLQSNTPLLPGALVRPVCSDLIALPSSISAHVQRFEECNEYRNPQRLGCAHRSTGRLTPDLGLPALRLDTLPSSRHHRRTRVHRTVSLADQRASQIPPHSSTTHVPRRIGWDGRRTDSLQRHRSVHVRRENETRTAARDDLRPALRRCRRLPFRVDARRVEDMVGLQGRVSPSDESTSK